MDRSILGCALLYALLSTLLRSSYPVLDEESYLFIAEQLSLSRPYDWLLPWPPYTDSYRYAHPPLFLIWIHCIVQLVGENIFWLKTLAGLPFQLMLGGCIGWFASTQVRAAEEEAAQSRLRFQMLCLFSPVVLLVGARASMPDLMYAAFGGLAMALFLGARSWRGYLLCGVALGLSCWTKYPALLLWIPILYVAEWRAWRVIAAGFLLTWGVGECWLWLLYGKWHLLVVLSTADHVGRGAVSDRGVGFLMRLLIACPAIVLIGIAYRSKIWIGWSIAALGVTWYVLPSLPVSDKILALLWVMVVIMGVLRCLRRLDFFALWLVSILVGVCATHNFSSPRYLILGMIPLAVLVERELRNRSKIWVYSLCAISLLLAVVIARAEHQYAENTMKLFAQLPQQTTGMYTGEWTFRAGARNYGLKLWKGQKEGLVLQPRQAVGGVLPKEFHLQQVYYGNEGYRILLDQENSVGYYAETLGFWPLGWKKGPLEELRVWTVR